MKFINSIFFMVMLLAFSFASAVENDDNHLVKVIKNFKKSANIEVAKYGNYSKDDIKVLWLNNGRKVKLLETLTFTDPNGETWIAPKGHIIDGASIPAPFQPIVGTPYGGKYVMASIIHDVACDEKKKSWKEVHKVFHYAMLASGVSSEKASLMYNAVYEGGPRWGADAEKRLSDKDFKKLISSSEFKPLVSDFKKIYGELKNYSGTAVYTAVRDGNPVVGVTKKYNGIYMNAEIGDGNPTYSVGWERPAEWGGQETSDRAMEELRQARKNRVIN